MKAHLALPIVPPKSSGNIEADKPTGVLVLLSGSSAANREGLASHSAVFLTLFTGAGKRIPEALVRLASG